MRSLLALPALLLASCACGDDAARDAARSLAGDAPHAEGFVRYSDRFSDLDPREQRVVVHREAAAPVLLGELANASTPRLKYEVLDLLRLVGRLRDVSLPDRVDYYVEFYARANGPRAESCREDCLEELTEMCPGAIPLLQAIARHPKAALPRFVSFGADENFLRSTVEMILDWLRIHWQH